MNASDIRSPSWWLGDGASGEANLITPVSFTYARHVDWSCALHLLKCKVKSQSSICTSTSLGVVVHPNNLARQAVWGSRWVCLSLSLSVWLRPGHRKGGINVIVLSFNLETESYNLFFNFFLRMCKQATLTGYWAFLNFWSHMRKVHENKKLLNISARKMIG